MPEIESIRQWLATAPDRREAEWVLAHVLQLPRLALPLDAPVPPEALPLAARLATGEPLQYVLGETDFFDLTLSCDPRALIPRPETEQLVERVLARIPANGACRVIDVGTGTGCIALAIAGKRPEAEVIGVDASPKALELALANAVRCDLAVQFELGDLLAAHEASAQMADLVVANLPYIKRSDIADLEGNVRDHEPHSALDGGPDGLDLIRRLLPQARTILRPGGSLFLEIGCDQGPAVHDLMVEAGFADVSVELDFAELDRFVIGMQP